MPNKTVTAFTPEQIRAYLTASTLRVLGFHTTADAILRFADVPMEPSTPRPVIYAAPSF